MSIPSWLADGVIREAMRQASCYVKNLPPFLRAAKPLLYVLAVSSSISTLRQAGGNLKDILSGLIGNYKFLVGIADRGSKDLSLTGLVLKQTESSLNIIPDLQFQQLLIKEFGPNYNKNITVIVNSGFQNQYQGELICSNKSFSTQGLRTNQNGIFKVKVSATWEQISQGVIQITMQSPDSNSSVIKKAELKFI